jgi:hypothetical protein
MGMGSACGAHPRAAPFESRGAGRGKRGRGRLRRDGGGKLRIRTGARGGPGAHEADEAGRDGFKGLVGPS